MVRPTVKNVIGLKLDIQEDLIIKTNHSDRKLVLSVPASCITVKDVKAYLVKTLCYAGQEIRLYLGDTVHQFADFSNAAVFSAFKDSTVR